MSKLYGIEKGDRIFYFTKSALNKEIKRIAAKVGLPIIRVNDLKHSEQTNIKWVSLIFSLTAISTWISYIKNALCLLSSNFTIWIISLSRRSPTMAASSGLHPARVRAVSKIRLSGFAIPSSADATSISIYFHIPNFLRRSSLPND